jgi:hypothetical protein
LELCRKYSRGTSKNRKRTKRYTGKNKGKTAGSGVTREEIGNMLEDFKTDILSSLSSQLDTLQIEEEEGGDKTSIGYLLSEMQNKAPKERMFIGSDRGLQNMQ